MNLVEIAQWLADNHPLARAFETSPLMATALTVGFLALAFSLPSGLGAALSEVVSNLAYRVYYLFKESIFCEIEFKDTISNFHYQVAERGTTLWKDSVLVVDKLGHSINQGSDFTGSYLGVYRGIPIWCFFEEENGRSVFRTLRPLRLKLLSYLQELAYELDDRDVETEEIDLGGMVSIHYNYREGGKLDSGHRNLFCRSWNTINVAEDAEREIRDWLDFFSKNPRYWRGKGLGWHTALVLHGPPGNGKSSIAKALAYEYGVNLYTINLRSLKDEDIPRLPSGSGIYLIEDFSAINLGTQEEGVAETDHISLSGLLNFIDGAWTPDGAIFIMTCNVLPKLDEALQRPGRMDKVVYIGNATTSQIEGMWRRLHPENPDLAERFAAAFPEGVYSMAQIENMILANQDIGKLIDLVETRLPPPYNVKGHSLVKATAKKAGRIDDLFEKAATAVASDDGDIIDIIDEDPPETGGLRKAKSKGRSLRRGPFEDDGLMKG